MKSLSALNFHPTADQLVNGTQPVYDVPPFTPKELAVLRSLDSANG